MSIFGAMESSVSGLRAQSNALGMISDNISNVNTVGFKETRAAFSTLVTQSATKTSFDPGGVRSQPLQQVGKQGLLQSSDSNTDVAVSGNGFFVVNESANPGVGDNVMFTRAGQFATDKDGNLVNSAGFFLQGWPIDAQGNLPAAQESLNSLQTVNVAGLSGLPRATDSIELGANLPATDPIGQNRSMTVQIFDSLGTAHNLDFTYTKTAANEWDVTVDQPVLSSDPTGPASGQFDDGSGNLTNQIQGTITFASDGSVNTITTTTAGYDITNLQIDYSDPGAGNATGATTTTVATDLGNPGANEFDALTQFDSGFAVSKINQNGLRFGNFTGVNIDDEGIVTAIFDNGRRRDLFKLPVATFNNPNQLEARSGNAYLRTNESGEVLLNEAGVGGAGAIAPSSLEGSTVDLATEFTDMITTQRAYSAATRVITTSDEMLQELTQTAR
jgi:flagellar hook protein FlgE